MAALIASCLLCFGPARAEDHGQEPVLGSWKLQVTPVAPPVPGFTSLITFSPGGGLVETRRLALPAVPGLIHNLLETPAHGAWERLGPRTWATTYTFLLQDPATGNEVGTDTIRWTATVGDDGDTISGPWKSSIVFFFPGGPHVDFQGTISGTRIKVQPL